MEDIHTLIFTCVIILTVAYVVRWQIDPLRKIPTLGGPSAPGLSYLAALNFILNGKALVEEGYQKYFNSAFKVATLDQWLVIVSGSRMIDELQKRSDEELSFVDGVEDLMQLKHTIGTDWIEDPYHIDIIKEKLLRSLPSILPDVIDEIKVAVSRHIPTKGDEWLTVNVMRTLEQIVAQASNRAFVGLPMCRNQAFLDLAVAFTMTVIKDSIITTLLPQPLKAPVGRMFGNTRKAVALACGYLKPLFEERRAKMEEFGDRWEDKPNDLLQRILEEAASRKDVDLGAAKRVLLTNFTAIHTSTSTITQALYDLAFRPEYLQPLRDEVEPIIAAEGWTKGALTKMWKVDSFFKESMRHNTGLTTVTRKAMKDITFNDGTFIPKGTVIAAAAHCTHVDETNYTDANAFDGFRFARMREVEGESTKHQYVNTSPKYIPFSHGRHACPGRFFAANELKAMLAYIVINYDLKMAGNGERPKNIYWAHSVLPSPSGEVSFRMRKVSM